MVKVDVKDYLKPPPKSKEQLLKELLELEKEKHRIAIENALLDKTIRQLKLQHFTKEKQPIEMIQFPIVKNGKVFVNRKTENEE